MKLNTIAPAPGSKKTKVRVGRGIGSGIGKTCGRGHKGQHARAGGYHKVGFEGGQMPIQRRLPKFGFRSRKAKHHVSLPLNVLRLVEGTEITVATLKASDLIQEHVKSVKFYGKAEISRPYNVRGIKVTVSAKEAVLAAGGQCE